MPDNATSNLLFGVVALQFAFITREQLATAMQEGATCDKSLAESLQRAGALTARCREKLDSLIEECLQRHNCDPERALAAIRTATGDLEDVLQSDNNEMEATLSFHRRSSLFDVRNRDAYDGPGSATLMNARFRVVRSHAEGGLGVVQIANDVELNREVALKEIKDRFADDPESRRRFVREALITGGLEHPGIVPVYALGKYANGRPYYAMRLIQGRSLTEEIKRFHADGANPYLDPHKHLELRKLLQRFVTVCESMEYAHSRGVLHRDLKPANIMLGAYGETLVVDWGLAKSQHDHATPDDPGANLPHAAPFADATRTGDVLGTPAYMSPEQALGRHDLLGVGSDIFSLGATLYSLLTNHRPVEGKNKDEVLENVRKGAVIHPRQRNPALPPPLSAICMKALTPQIKDRYSSARDLAADIERYLADEPVSIYREPFRTRAKRWVRKNSALVTGALTMLTVTTLALSIFGYLIAAKNRELEQTKAIAVSVKDFLIHDMLELAAAERQANAGFPIDPETKVQTLMNRALKKIERQSSTSPEVAAELLQIATEGSRKVSPDMTIREAVMRAAGKIDGLFQNQPLLEAEIRWFVGVSLLELGEFREAVIQLTRTKSLFSKLAGVSHPDTLRCLENLANAYNAVGRSRDAVPLSEVAFELRRKALGAEHDETRSSLVNLASTYLQVGRTEEAVALLESAINEQPAKVDTRSVTKLKTMSLLAYAYAGVGRQVEAISLAEKTLDLQRDVLGGRHPHTLQTSGNLANFYFQAKRWDDAIAQAQNTLRSLREAVGPDHPDSLRTMGNIGAMLMEAGRQDQALEMLEEGLKLQQQKLGRDHPDTLATSFNLATAYLQAGHFGKSIPLFVETLQLQKSKLGSEHPYALASRQNLARAYAESGQPIHAIPLLEEVLRITEANQGATAAETLAALEWLASACQAAGKPEDSASWRAELKRRRLSTM